MRVRIRASFRNGVRVKVRVVVVVRLNVTGIAVLA